MAYVKLFQTLWISGFFTLYKPYGIKLTYSGKGC